MTKLTLYKMILNEIEKQPRGFAGELAIIAGYSSSSNFLRTIKKECGEFDSFQGLVNVVKYLFPDKEKELLELHSSEINPKHMNSRCMLEYLSCNRLLDSMKNLIDRMIECGNSESEEWAKAYSLQYDWQKNYFSLEKTSYIKSIRELRPVTIEIRFFQTLLECHFYYSEGKDNIAYEISKDLESQLGTIKNSYIRHIYQMKVNEVLAYINLWVLNNPEESRKNAQIVIDSEIGLTFTAFGYYVIGCSHFLTSFDQSVVNLQKSYDIYLSINREDAASEVKKFIDRLSLFWEMKITYDEIIHDENKIYYKIKNNLEVETLLDKVKDSMEKAEYFYFVGIYKKDKNFLMRSLIHFLKRGDSLFANLPKIELLKIGEDEDVLNDLIAFHVA